MQIHPPAPAEYEGHFGHYISLVPGADALAALESQIVETLDALRPLSDREALYRYAPEKWSVKETAGHMIDTERIFCYRALRFARNDQTPLPGFEQDDYVRGADFDRQDWRCLLDELETVRRATLLFFRGLAPQAFDRRGLASGKGITVRAWAYIVAGHELHHLNILRTRYLPGAKGIAVL